MSIFISIASYQDPLLVSTIYSAYQNASDKDALVFGICDQSDEPDNILGIEFAKQINYEHVALSSPSEATLQNVLDETATDILFLIFYRIFYEDAALGKPPGLFLSCDKATNGGFVKIISWYSKTKKKVEQRILDVDRTYGDSKTCAKAM